MSIYVGPTELDNLKVGGDQVQAVYVGSDLVWQYRTADFSSGYTATSQGTSITIPASASDGDIAILVRGGYGSTAHTTPSGWTQLDIRTGGSGGTTRRSTIYFKKLGASDPGSSVTLNVGSSNIMFTGTQTGVTGAIVDSANVQDTTGTQSNQTITASSTSSYPIVAVACKFAIFCTPVPTITASLSGSAGEQGGSHALGVKWQSWNSSASNIVVSTVNDNAASDSIMHSFYIRLT